MSLTLIDIARYKSLIEQRCSCTIRYFDRPDSFCKLVTWPTKISDDTLAYLFNKCNITLETSCSEFIYIVCQIGTSSMFYLGLTLSSKFQMKRNYNSESRQLHCYIIRQNYTILNNIPNNTIAANCRVLICIYLNCVEFNFVFCYLIVMMYMYIHIHVLQYTLLN